VPEKKEFKERKNKMIRPASPQALKPVTHTRLIIFVSAAISLLSGCAGLSDYGCQLQESRSKSADLATHYRLSTPLAAPAGNDQLPKGVPIKVTHYTVRFNVEQIQPCTTLSIIKEVVLQRNADTDILLKETREFYAEDGTLITSLTEDLTSQLARSGEYAAVTPLPIPRSAPAGKYRIVSKLTQERKSDKKSLLLSAAEAVFSIIPR
jgi:hypothetical protein